jgi:hypothetical protein
MPDQSRITINPAHGITSYDGPDAVALFRATLLRRSLQLYAKTGMIPTRGVTITVMLGHAAALCGKPRYKRTQVAQAIEDVNKWILAMQCAIPVEVRQ